MGRRRIALLLVLGLLASLLGALFVRRVPPGHAVLLEGGRVLGPGWHLTPPSGDRWLLSLGLQELTFRSPEIADFRLYDRERGPLEAEARVTGHLSVDDLRAFAEAHGARAPIAVAQETLRSVLRTWVATARAESLVAESRSPEGRAALARSLQTPLTTALGPAWVVTDLRFFTAGTSTKRRILLVGVDGADWKIMDPLLAAGELPHVAALRDQGAAGPLESILPLLSPLIWTTIATGVAPATHGVLDFVTKDKDGSVRPVGSTDRRVPALWNLMEPCGKRVAVTGWLATYPAERVPGTLVSDRFGFLAFVEESTTRSDSRVTWPPELAQEAEAFRVPPRDLPRDLVSGFAHVPAESLAAAQERGFKKGKLLNNLLHTIAAAETNRRLARWQWERDAPDLGLFYFELVDAVGHLTMPFAPPRSAWIAEPDYAAYQNAVAAAYRYQDTILGDLMDAAGESTLVVVLSDHGFKSGAARPRTESEIGEAGAAHWHTPQGVLLLAGPGVRAGAAIAGARVMDIAPTLLAWLGCPVPATMEGRVLGELFDPPLAGATTGSAPSAASTDATTAAGLNNLGLSHSSAGRLDEALAAFQEAAARDPRSVTARNNVGMVLLRLARPVEAARVLEEAVTVDAGYPPAWLNLGLAYMGLKDPVRAREALRTAQGLDPGNPRVLRSLGYAALDLAQWDEASGEFRASLEIEDTADGRFGLAMALLRSGDRPGAERELRRALQIDPRHENARRALASLGGSP